MENYPVEKGNQLYYGLADIAKLYAEDLPGIISLMREYDIAIDSSTTNNELISSLKRLFEEDKGFRANLRELIYTSGIGDKYNNQADEFTITADPISAIAKAAGEIFGAVGGIWTARSAKQTAEIEARASNDRFFQDIILGEVGKKKKTTIFIAAGGTLLIFGLVVFFMMKRNKS